MGECLILKSGGGTDTSDATATKEVILSGYTAYVNDVKLTGEMKNNGLVSETLNAGESYTVNSGYYSGGTVSVNSLASQTDANAAAAQILNTYTGWVKGSLITGNMANKGAVTASLAANGTYTIPSGWHSGSGKVSQSLTTQAAATVTPGTANKVACAASRWTTGAVTISGASTLTAGNIKNGVKIFGVTGTWTGWVDKNIYIIQNGNLVNGFSPSCSEWVWQGTYASGEADAIAKPWSSGGYYWLEASGRCNNTSGRSSYCADRWWWVVFDTKVNPSTLSIECGPRSLLWGSASYSLALHHVKNSIPNLLNIQDTSVHTITYSNWNTIVVYAYLIIDGVSTAKTKLTIKNLWFTR